MLKSVQSPLLALVWRFLIFCLFCNGAIGTRDEYFLSVTGLENLLNIEIVMLDQLQHYVDSIQSHINMLQSSSMSWQDCFYIGQHLYEINNFNHTIEWMKQSEELLKKQEKTDDPYVLDVMETIVAYYQGIGDLDNALELVDYILSIDASRGEIANLKLTLEHMIRDGNKTGLMYELPPQAGDYHLTEDFKRYEQVCRGELLLTPAEQRILKCRFVSNNVPYRLLQPFKVEEISLDPPILQIHGVLSEDDTNLIKDLSKTRVSRSVVRSADGFDDSAVDYRISKSAWFAYNETRQFGKIQRCMKDLSLLNMESAEQFQVTNYGIGGHYEPHFDFFIENQTYTEGNRIATGIFYLSEVEEGGGTAFPHLRVLVKPEHGSVLFWYNLHRSGEPDFRTRHAACPVLKGSKWIGNIWVRERHQSLERPCELEPDHEISLKYKYFQ
ncbi:prolyl 4-hydroxylase subunit alpha-2 isoform X2 [Eurosta solidaginis]|uniref:prolyl 4-hydroxylase subunit alpha-2 isoform X2 n=1 Tax=Eurosta solidaginis TaxID=178769 RepID=UPI0035315C8F